MRKYLEKETQKKCIPVWHLNRGKDDYLRMCDAYDYVAVGGLVSSESIKRLQKAFPWFIEQAHAAGAQIHGLGYVKMDKLLDYHFDSVDSTTWCSARFGKVSVFNGSRMKSICSSSKRVRYHRETNVTSFQEWIKFQKYAEVHL
jgi:hypothetical protein